jgi:hypothetical protein
MATATQTPETPQASAAQEANVTSERTDYVVGFNIIKTKDEQGQEATGRQAAFYPYDTEERIQLVKQKIEKQEFVQLYQVTVSIPRAKNYAGCREICPDEEEGASSFNRGAKAKANNRLKATFTDVTEDGKLVFDPEGKNEDGTPVLTNGVLDMTKEIASPSQRKVLSEEEKLDRFLKDFPEATRQMMKQAYLASRQAPPTA